MKIISWNILADRYFTKERYTDTNNALFNWNYRRLLILDNIRSFLLTADIICLQEVELSTFDNDFSLILNGLNYCCHKISKKRSNPIGNVVLSKYPIKILKETTHSLIVQVDYGNNDTMTIANIHLSVDSTDEEKICTINKIINEFNGVILVGDFNTTSLEFQGYHFKKYKTCKTRYNWHEFDYIMAPFPIRTGIVNKEKNIPNIKNPSDHIPICATYWDEL